MRRLILAGRVGAGKTTLMQALKGEQLSYCKTQYISYTDTISDIPGILRSYWFLNKDDDEVITLIFFQGDDSAYSYKDDFDKIVASLH